MDGLRVRGGITEEEGEGGAGSGSGTEGGDEAEEMIIGGTGTDMVVMSEAIVLLYPALCFLLSFPLSCFLQYVLRALSHVTKGARTNEDGP